MAGKTANAAALFHAFHDAVLACGPPFEVVATKTMVVYRGVRAFASVTVHSDCLDIELLLPGRKDDARLRDTPRAIGAGFAHRIRIVEATDLDQMLRGWVCSACVFGQD